MSNAWGAIKFGLEGPIIQLYNTFFVFLEKNVIQVQTPNTLFFPVQSTGSLWALIPSSALQRPPASASCPEKCADAQAISNPILHTSYFRASVSGTSVLLCQIDLQRPRGNFPAVKHTCWASLSLPFYCQNVLAFPYCISKPVSSTEKKIFSCSPSGLCYFFVFFRYFKVKATMKTINSDD